MANEFIIRKGFKSLANSEITGNLSTTGSNTLIGLTTLTGSLNVTGSTTQIGNNTLLGNTLLSGSLTISGSTTIPSSPTVRIYGDAETNGVIKFVPVSKNIDTSISGSYIYVSGSTNDLYFSQNGSGYANTTRLKWLEGNLYTGLLHGGLITTQSSTVYQVASGSGVIVNLNASLNDDPYPVINFLEWPNLSASIAPLSASYDQSFVAVLSDGTIGVQGTPYNDGDFNTKITIGIVVHQNRSTINAVQTFPNVAYGYKQRTFDFIKAFGPLKIAGYTLSPSGSSSGSLVLSGGTAWVDGRNYTIDPSNPSYIVEAQGLTTSKIFRYRQSGSGWVYDTNAGVGYQTIDPSNYSLNGTLTPVATNDWSIQRVYYFPNSAVKALYVYYGNATYATKADALSAIATETFAEAPNTAANAIFLGYLILRYNADFTTAASYQIQSAGLFRGSGGVTSGGGGGGATALTGLTDVSISTPTDAQPLAYNIVTDKWENRTAISASLKGNADTATSASYATTSSIPLLGIVTASAVNTTITFTKGDGSTFSVAIAQSGSVSSASYSTTASYAQTASYVVTAQTASYVLQAVSSSFASTASYVQNALTASYVQNALTASYVQTAQTASYVLNAISSSFSSTASYSPNYLSLSGGTINGNVTLNGTASITYLNVLVQSSSIIYSSGSNQFGDATNDTQTLIGRVIVSGSLETTGSLNVVGGITGSLQGTSSWANNALTASFITTAQTASYVLNAISSSFAQSSLSSSYALTASYAMNGGGGAAFPFTGNALITGNLNVTQNITASFVTASVISIGSTRALNTIATITSTGTGTTALRVNNGAGTDYMEYLDTGQFRVYNSNAGRTGIWDGYDLTVFRLGRSGYGLINFDGEFAMRDEVNGTNLIIASATSRFVKGLGVNTSGANNASAAFQVDSTTKGVLLPRMTTTERNAISTPATGLLVYDTSLLSLYQYNGSSWAAVGGGGSAFPFTGSAVITGSLVVTGSVESTLGFTGSLLGTASYASSALSSSYALTSSYTLNVTPAFPFTGNALITGSLRVDGSGSFRASQSNAVLTLTDATTNANAIFSIASPIGGSPQLELTTDRFVVNGITRLGTVEFPSGFDTVANTFKVNGSNDSYLQTDILNINLIHGGRVKPTEINSYTGYDLFLNPTGSNNNGGTGNVIIGNPPLTPAFKLNVSGSGNFLGSVTTTNNIIASGSGFTGLAASENLAAGDLVNIFSGGVRKASNNDTTKQAHGFVIDTVTTGTAVTVYYSGLNTTITGLTAGSRYFLGTAGAETLTPPTAAGQLSQEIGVAISTTALLVNFGPAIIT